MIQKEKTELGLPSFLQASCHDVMKHEYKPRQIKDARHQ